VVRVVQGSESIRGQRSSMIEQSSSVGRVVKGAESLKVQTR